MKYQVVKSVPYVAGGMQIDLNPVGPAEGEQVAGPKSRGLIKLVGLETEAAAEFTLGAVFEVSITSAK